MAGDGRGEKWLLADEGVIGRRLSPAEAHAVVRQQLAPLLGPWGLKPADPAKLARRMDIRLYEPGEIIVPRGSRADCLGLVVRGQVAVQVGQRGAARLVVVLLPGSAFGQAMLAEGQPSQATLQALGHCEIRFLRRADLQALSAERRMERQVAVLWRWVRGSALLLALLFALALTLSLAPGRQVLALLPMGIGQWCDQQELVDCAGQAWQVAANLAPRDPNPLLALGNWHFGQGDVAAAEVAFEAARALAPDAPEAYNNLGLVYARQGDHTRAIAAFRQALSLEPGVAASEHNLALSLQASSAYEEALEHYQAALALGEPQANTLVNMAIASYEAGQPDRAVELARQALAQDGSLAAAYTILGAVALESRQPDEALLALQRATALDASYGQAYFYLGLAYKSMGQPAEAIIAFERALAAAGDEVTRVRVRRHLNELYEPERQGELP